MIEDGEISNINFFSVGIGFMFTVISFVIFTNVRMLSRMYKGLYDLIYKHYLRIILRCGILS